MGFVGLRVFIIIALCNIEIIYGYGDTDVACIKSNGKPAICPKGSICTSSSYYCFCPYEFQLYQNNACVSVAGAACKSKSDCIDGADCDVNSNCACRKERAEDRPSGKCLGLPGETCADDSACATAQGVTCDTPTNKCKCTSMFGVDGPCFKDQSAKCDTDNDCNQHPYPKGLKCLNNICDCEYGQNYNKDFIPLGVSANPKPSAAMTGKCEIPLERRCNPGEPDKCTLDQYCDNQLYRCQCRPNAEYNKETKKCVCKKQTIDNKNTKSCDCYSGASLVAGACQCQTGHEMHDSTQTCQPVCQENAEHDATGACVCKKDYKLNDMQKCVEVEKPAAPSKSK